MANQGGGGGYPGQAGYYGTGGGSGYIHGTPQDDINAWNIFLEMWRNGWNPYQPFGIEEARRGMGQFTQEEWDRYIEAYLKGQQPNISGNDFEQPAWDESSPTGGTGLPGDFTPGQNPPLEYGKWNDWIVALLGKGKLGRLGLGKWLKQKQGEATLDDWLTSLNDDQRQWVDEWMIGLGADKNWTDRLRQGDAPWSRAGEVAQKTGSQNPDRPLGIEHPEPPPGGLRRPRDNEGGGEGDEGPAWTPPPVGNFYSQGQTFNPYFLQWQPQNTSGPIQFTTGYTGK